MSKAVTKTEEKKTQLPATMAQAPREEILKSDVIIPKLLLMQGLSDFVNERKAQQGDIMRSTTIEKLGDPEHPISFIPLTFTNDWRLEEEENGKYKFRGNEPRTAKNEDSPWEFEKNGTRWKRTKVINVFALLPQDIKAEQAEVEKFKTTGEMPDLNKTLLPVVISFRSTSYNAGKAVATHFAKAAAMAKYGVKPYGFSLQLKCYADKNEKGAYYVYEIGQGGQVSAAELEKAHEWYQILSTQKVQVDESEEGAEATAGATQTKF